VLIVRHPRTKANSRARDINLFIGTPETFGFK
jgi:hypothetical protein